MKPKRVYRPDEEPEWDEPDHWTPHEFIRGLCEFCGHEGHRNSQCPNRPLETK